MKHILLFVFALFATALPLAGRAASAGSVTVGNPKDPGALAPAIQAAYLGGARHIIIRPGVYLLPNIGHTAIELKNWKNATISASHVTLILTDLKWTHDLFDLIGCSHVTVAGPLVSQTGLIAYQGRVVAVGTDAAGKFYTDWKPDTGYPVPPADSTKFPGGDANVVDAHTRRLKVGTGDFYGVAMDPPVDGVYRVHYSHAQENIAVGDWLVGRYGDAPFKFYLNNSRDCTIRDVTMTRNGFAPLREDGGGGNHYLHIRWALGPPPQGATEDPLVTNTADGMHMIGSYPGPDVEDCTFEGVFLDDCIAIHGYFQTIVGVQGNTVTLNGDAGALVIGQPARISDQHGFYAQGVVTALHDNGDKTTTVTLDKDYGVPTDGKMSNPLADGAGYKIIGCHLGDTRSRGILAKADNGLIKNNTIIGCGMSAVSLGPEYYWGEADYVHHVKVIGNTLIGNGQAFYGGQAIYIHGDGAVGNQDILIQGNFLSSNYQGDIYAEWADGVTITGNTTKGPAEWPANTPSHPPIALANCRNVTLKGNVVKTPAAFHGPLVVVGKNVTGVVNNDLAGIRTVGRE
jgi:hypothetical protein